MTNEIDLTINRSSYGWAVRAFRTVEKHLGLKIAVHDHDNLLKKGHIFLFNHFARFETIVPPYIIYRATKEYCRSVADYELFNISEGFGGFLRGVGAVPNNTPGLLPFLAAEILRGRKVVMFPEGGMVKDRRVVDDAGDLGIFSRTADEWRKQHRGAAVLSLTLDIFKRRILDLEAMQDRERLSHWVKALKLQDQEELLDHAKKPTIIVPANITFYPIRVQENMLSRGAEMFTKGLPKILAEELLIEGNLLFKKTDMDIRISNPVQLQKKWPWWERILLKRHFVKVESLDDLFGLKDHAEGVAERMLARCLCNETQRIRDEYMNAMYKATTVNMSHLASHVIVRLIGQGRMEISNGEFHRILYMSLKNLQATMGVHLHRSLNHPDCYRGLIDGENPELDLFLRTAKNAELVDSTPGSYRFMEKLCEDFTFDEIRLENPIMVYNNEVAPIAEVCEAVDAAMNASQTVSEEEIASFLFDDELRLHAWNRDHYADETYSEINDQETAGESGAPYLLLPKEHVKTGVLLVHGFLSSPVELRGLGNDFLHQGYAVFGVRLSGHGTSPWDLKTRTWHEWLKSVRRGLRILAAFCHEVVVVGFSAGGTLALLLAAEKHAGVVGVSASCTPISFRDHKMSLLVPVVHGINKMTGWMTDDKGIFPFHKNDSEHPEINYANIPIDALSQLNAMTSELERRLVDVTLPAQILQADEDPVISPQSAEHINKKLGSTEKHIHMIHSQRHGILKNDIGGARLLVSRFIADIAKKKEHL